MANRSWAIILTAIWFILWGLFQVTNITFEAQGLLMGVLALLVGICWLVGK